jgi:hypothetical protein
LTNSSAISARSSKMMLRTSAMHSVNSLSFKASRGAGRRR